ncbi:hypothetical protein CSC04_0470 [Enterobacter roggenkampii]|nr:hypothetical protein CSC04_0470 [Enterobacter roggenkampii]
MAGGAALTRPTVYSVGPVSVSATGHIRKNVSNRRVIYGCNQACI